MSTNKKRIVILGGGLAGLPLALHLEKQKKIEGRVEVILIDRKEYFEMNCESIRFLIQPELHTKFVATHCSYLKTTQFICANIIGVDSHNVEIERVGTKELIHYDYLVVALGTKYDFFKASSQTIKERKEQIEDFANRVRVSNNILIVGGRTVGVEFMGEVINLYPSKNIIIVHSGDTLLDYWPDVASQQVKKYTFNKRVTIYIFGRKMVKSEGNQHYLDDGTIIEADMKVITSGMAPNSDALHPFFDSSLSSNNYLRVHPSLQVEGFNNIFAIGDIIDLKIPKLAANIRQQKKTITANLEALVLGKEPIYKLKSSKFQEVSLVSLGPSYAIMVLPITKGIFSVIANGLVSLFKTEMFIRLTKNPSLI